MMFTISNMECVVKYTFCGQYHNFSTDKTGSKVIGLFDTSIVVGDCIVFGHFWLFFDNKCRICVEIGAIDTKIRFYTF